MSEWFDVRDGTSMVCGRAVLYPLLYNIYMDFVLKQAFSQMPEGCCMESGITWQAT